MPMHSMLEKRLVPLGGGTFQEKRFFSDSIIQAQDEKALENVEGDGAVLVVRLNNETIGASLAARLNDQWSVGIIVERKHTGEFSAGAKVVFDW